jgi:hypothetical protein
MVIVDEGTTEFEFVLMPIDGVDDVVRTECPPDICVAGAVTTVMVELTVVDEDEAADTVIDDGVGDEWFELAGDATVAPKLPPGELDAATTVSNG